MIFLRMLLSLLLPAISGVLLTFLLLPGGDRVRPSMLLFRLFTGIGFGLGIASCLQFLCLLAGTPRAVIALDLAVCLALGFTVWFHGRQAAGDEPALVGKDHQPRSGAWFDRLLSPLFGLGLVAWLVSFAVATLREPQGRWDAWLIWNMHARFLYRGGEAWRDAFASGLDWSHWDYPLLLPLSILRGWIYAGQEELRMPAVIALVFTFLTLGLLVSALCVFRHRTQGLLAGLLLLGTPFFIAMGAAQFADVPLAFFILATVTILTWQQRSVRPGALALAGLAAGLAAWTKNEGLLFILVVAGSFTLIMAYRKGLRPALRGAAAFLAGLLPVLLIILCFKLNLAPANDILAGLDPVALGDKLLDGSRYIRILQSFFITGLSFTQGIFDVRQGMALNLGAVNVLLPLVYLLLAGISDNWRAREGSLLCLTILALTLAGYFVVYLLTPLDLEYHLLTSLNRLFIQLWPAFLLAVFLVAGNDEAETGRDDGSSPVGKSSGKGRTGRAK